MWPGIIHFCLIIRILSREPEPLIQAHIFLKFTGTHRNFAAIQGCNVDKLLPDGEIPDVQGEGVAGLPNHLHLDAHLALQGEVVRDDKGDQGDGVPHRSHIPWQSEAGVLVRKLSQPIPLSSQAKRANPQVFHHALLNQLWVSRPFVDSKATIGWFQTKP